MEELIKRAAEDLINSKYPIALTGAGISTESGIPDFRGPSGIWTKDPEAERRAYQTYERFLRDPKGYWEGRLSPDNPFRDLSATIEKAKPNPGHYALAELEKMGILKCIITQNVDGLHQKAGSENVIEYHGSILKLRCISCGLRIDRDEIDLEELRIQDRLPPTCKRCGAALKSDTVSFREPIPTEVFTKSRDIAWKCDLMLICGTSAVVYPFAELPRLAKQRRIERESKTPSGLFLVELVPATKIIEINAEPTVLTKEEISDYLIQGKTGEILPQIVKEIKSRTRRI